PGGGPAEQVAPAAAHAPAREAALRAQRRPEGAAGLRLAVAERERTQAAGRDRPAGGHAPRGSRPSRPRVDSATLPRGPLGAALVDRDVIVGHEPARPIAEERRPLRREARDRGGVTALAVHVEVRDPGAALAL